jgi:hypothetical protein
MIFHPHIVAALARERCGTFLAEAEAARRANQARSRRQLARTPGASRWRLRSGPRPVVAAVRPAPISASAHSSQRSLGVLQAGGPEPGC